MPIYRPSVAGGVYRYEDLESNFTADLLIDAQGLVVDYPGIWKRAEMRPLQNDFPFMHESHPPSPAAPLLPLPRSGEGWGEASDIQVDKPVETRVQVNWQPEAADYFQ